MTEETPATSTDNALGTEGDSDQLPLEDTLIDRGVDDILDEGYSPPERPRTNTFGETAEEEAEGETIEQRVAQEEPETWQAPDPHARQLDRAGRLEEDAEALDGRGNDVFADDDGVAGGAATAEEAAMHVEDEIEP
ncbi:MAG: DUF5709 domain-containing protein [Cellulomonadaceae bacterium]